MDKLRSLDPVFSPEAEIQASEICALMGEATRTNKTYIIYAISKPRKIHPLVVFTLTSKGYSIDDISDYKMVYNQYKIFII